MNKDEFEELVEKTRRVLDEDPEMINRRLVYGMHLTDDAEHIRTTDVVAPPDRSFRIGDVRKRDIPFTLRLRLRLEAWWFKLRVWWLLRNWKR